MQQTIYQHVYSVMSF